MKSFGVGGWVSLGFQAYGFGAEVKSRAGDRIHPLCRAWLREEWMKE